ncbi:hypothetical protein [Natronospira sp.]|uniref:hypothetical protein n=1 Tax=Natronospira sp. TaxID=2024970 RepID=UPI0038730768
MRHSGLILSLSGALMAVFAAALLLYTAALILTESLLPAVRMEQPELARASILGQEFSGYAVLFPAVAYLLMGFIALALGIRQARRGRLIWRGDDDGDET